MFEMHVLTPAAASSSEIHSCHSLILAPVPAKPCQQPVCIVQLVERDLLAFALPAHNLHTATTSQSHGMPVYYEPRMG